MIIIAERKYNIGCFVTKKEYQKILENVQKYGFKTNADYIRAALDFFDARRYNASKNNEISIISDCIKLLEKHKQSVTDTMVNESIKQLHENLDNEKSNMSETIKETDEKLDSMLDGIDEKTIKENDEQLDNEGEVQNALSTSSFEEVIETLIRLTHVKGKPSDKDFKFQASRCSKTKKEIEDYYDEHYSFFVEEADKYI